MKKDFIRMMLKKYNCQSVKVVSKIDENFAGSISNKEFRIIFDIENSENKRHLVIQDTITKDNIHLYYEFMSNKDIKNNINIISNILYSRHIKVNKELFLSSVNLDEKNKYVFVSRLESVFATVVSFGVKDTLKPIDEYVAEIKASKEYKEYKFKAGEVVITKDNIADYYEFMSDDDLEKYNYLIDDILKDRIIKIHTSLDIDFLEFLDNCIVPLFLNDNYISLISFGVKDTLKPIEEYIKEIKESEQYKEYMSKKVA